jgi:anti-anti-sigma factor
MTRPAKNADSVPPTTPFSNGQAARTPAIEVGWYDTDIALVTLVGEHDLATQTELKRIVHSHLRAGELVIVDLSKAEYLDSSTINVLAAADRMAQERHLTFTLQLGGATVARRVLEICGLLEHLTCTETREQAIEAARQPRPQAPSAA